MNRDKICCIYKITNKLNNRCYIGQTVDYFRRLNEYKNRKYKKSSKYRIIQEIQTVGIDNFKFRILKKCSPDELDYYEMYYINKFKSYDEKYGYNSMHKNKSTNKLNMNDYTKLKMKESHIGLKESASTKKKKSNIIYAVKYPDFIISDSGKLFGDYICKSKDYIKNCIRQPSTVSGYNLFYADKTKRQKIKEKMLQKRCIRNKEYMKILDYIDNSSVETIENDYNVIYLQYNDHE